MEDNKLTLKENSNSSEFSRNSQDQILKKEINRLKLNKVDSLTNQHRGSEQAPKYNRIVKMMGTINNTGSEKPSSLNQIPEERQDSSPINIMLKAYEKQREKEKTEEGNDIVNQLRNKLIDFEKDLEVKTNEDGQNDSSRNEEKVRPEKKHQLVNMLPQDTSSNEKFLKNRIFWSKEKMHRVREKFFNAKKRIDNKTYEDFNSIRRWIEEGETETVISTLLNEHFKAFYKLEIKKQGILEFMIESNKPEMLKSVLEDEFYIFNYNFIFDHIGKFLKQKEKGLDIGEEELGTLLTNIIKYELYSKSQVKMFAWFIGSFKLFNLFRSLADTHTDFDEFKDYYNNFENDNDINEYIESDNSYKETIIACLENNLENLAIALMTYQQEIKDNSIIDHAVVNNSLMFLRFIWEHTNKNEDKKKNKKTKTSLRDTNRSKSMFNIQFNLTKRFNHGEKVFTLSELIRKFARCIPANTASIHEIISSWHFIEKDEHILETLFEVFCFDEVSALIYRKQGKWEFTKKQFEILIEQGELDLILYYLKLRQCRTILYEPENQKKIVHKYIKYGHKMYYGAEMLKYITKVNWDMSLTGDLLKYVEKTLKNKDILKCHSPILTSLLLCEFISHIGESSIQHKVGCDKVKLRLCKFAHSIQEANPEEKYIKFLMTQKDTRGRTSYQIASENSYYSVLQTPEVGTLVQKMWNGRLSHNGLLDFSSIYKYLDSSSSTSQSPFNCFESFDMTKTYFHQLNLWTESASLRYWPESLSTILLIAVYNFFIIFLINRTTEDQEIKTLMMPVGKLEADLRFMAYLYIFWTFCIVLNIPLQYLFGILSNRRYYMDKWNIIEVCMLMSSVCLILDTTEIFPPKDDLGNIIPSDGKSDNAFILRAVILSINDAFVWLRVTGIFLTFKNLGPLIRMIYLLCLTTLKYLVVFAIVFACCSAIFTTLFYNSSEQFESFSVTFTSLFSFFLGNANAFDFTEYHIFGAIMVMVFTTLSGILLMNLLIAVLSSEYEILSEIVDAAHRTVLINYFRRYKWNREWGFLIFLTTPLNIFNIAVLPFSICFNKKNFNKFISRVNFILFYLPLIIVFQTLYCVILSPACYLKAMMMMINYQFNSKSNICSKFIGWLSWVVLGYPFILFIIFRDIALIFYSVFHRKDVISLEKTRIQKYITKDDIRIFLQFIHGRQTDEPNDLHILFLNYLSFDQDKKAENDKSMKEKSIYLQQLRTAAGLTLKKTSKQHNSILLYSNKTSHQGGNNNSNSNMGFEGTGGVIKRNLIIIEILENFLIDDGTDNFIVDIEKLKMLLPKTMNINNSYIKRILHTEINSLNKAINKLKNKKFKFLQNRLLNKISGATIRLDHVVDNTINDDPLYKEADRKKHKFEVEENEDDFYSELQGLMTRITSDIHNSVKSAKAKSQSKNLSLSIKENNTGGSKTKEKDIELSEEEHKKQE